MRYVAGFAAETPEPSKFTGLAGFTVDGKAASLSGLEAGKSKKLAGVAGVTSPGQKLGGQKLYLRAYADPAAAELPQPDNDVTESKEDNNGSEAGSFVVPGGGFKTPSADIDFDLLAQKLHEGYKDKCVGYGFAIFHNDKLVKSGAGGMMRREPDAY